MKNQFNFRPLWALLCTVGLLAGFSVAGCSGSQAPKPAANTARTGPQPGHKAVALRTEEQEQREAQQAWCRYLEALYLRATDGSARWSRFNECAQATTTAAPAMLRRTADCSLQALANFQGDPLTDAYAAKVRICGAQALDATVASAAEIEPLVSVICERAQECDSVKDTECRASLMSEDGPRIGRAMGAISQAGREALRACVVTAPCEDLHTMVLTCLGPIMDRLLWLPE